MEATWHECMFSESKLAPLQNHCNLMNDHPKICRIQATEIFGDDELGASQKNEGDNH